MDLETLKDRIGANIALQRKRAGLTQAGLAEKLNYSDKAVSKWERGESTPDILTLMQLAELFETTVDSLLADPNALPADAGTIEQDKELMAIFERTYGKVERKAFEPTKKPARTELSEKYNIREQYSGPEYLLVDGYNIIFAWEELAALAKQDVAAARGVLTDILANYRGYHRGEVILVFDAYKVKGNPGSVEKVNGIYVVYTKEAETADAYIEKTTYDLGRKHRVRVATSDGLEQVIILGHGALRLSARTFKAEVEQAQGQISRMIAEHNRRGKELDKLSATARIMKRK